MPIYEKCQGCAKATNGDMCAAYPGREESKWRLGNCMLATHIKKEVKKDDFKLNTLKASKRGAKQ